MTERRDSKGRFTRGNVPWNKRQNSPQKGMASLVVPKMIGEGVKLERFQVICPACGQQVEAVATDGRVKGYCAAAEQYVDFLIETQRVRTDKDNIAEARAKISAAIKKRWQDPEYRAKQIATHIGRHPTAETRAKISEAIKRRYRKGERYGSESQNSGMPSLWARVHFYSWRAGVLFIPWLAE